MKLLFILISILIIMSLGCEKQKPNNPPVINEIIVSKTVVKPGEIITINVVANDPDGDELEYKYEESGGEIEGHGNMVTWKAPKEEGTYIINITVYDRPLYELDEECLWVQKSITVEVRKEGQPPEEMPPPQIEQGLIGYWPFDEGTGKIAHDLSGNGHDAKIFGAEWVNGIKGRALSFDNRDYVKVEDFPNLKSNTSYSVWFKTSERKSGIFVFEDRSYQSSFFIDKDGKATFYVWHDVATFVRSLTPVDDGRWHHAAIVLRSKSIDLYIDGELHSTEFGYPKQIQLNFVIGKSKAWGLPDIPYYFRGVIDEVKVYDRALNDEKIKSLAKP